jgi:hypothetical protein
MGTLLLVIMGSVLFWWIIEGCGLIGWSLFEIIRQLFSKE